MDMPTECLPTGPRASGPRRAAAAALLLASSCSVADNLSYTDIVTELDRIVTIQGTGADRRVVYAARAQTSAWYMRQFLLLPFGWLLGPTLGYTQETVFENASGHVRELLLELPDETGSDLLACANATSRFGWIAELDGNGSSRIVAIDGMATLVARLGIPMFAVSFEHLGESVAPERLIAARAGIQVGRPEVRGEEPWDDARLQPYLEALDTIVEAPLDDWTQRLLLIEDLIVLCHAEHDERARPATMQALRKAIGFCVQGILLHVIQERDAGFVEVRLCAMESIRRLGGPRTVPLMLAVMAGRGRSGDTGVAGIDPDWLVQLRLIHYCGQLSGELAMTSVHLPGRAEWESVAPAEFLAQTILNEQTYYSKLRTPALAALTWCLGRPRVDPDSTWVRDWWREHQSRS